jgi:outer membrane protein assembly factor BamB
MPPKASDKRLGRRVCASIFCVIVIFVGTVWCGNGATSAYNSSFTTSPNQCRGTNTAPLAGERVLSVAVIDGPNITLCHLRASDGTLLRYFNLTIHGDIIGHADGLLYINERGGTNGTSLALCAVQIDNGVTRWCQRQVTEGKSITASNGTVYANASSSQTAALFAIQETTGQVIWHRQMQPGPDDVPTQILIEQGQLYVPIYQAPQASATATSTASALTNQTGSTGSLCAFLVTSGQQNWCHAFPGEIIEKLAMDDSAVYVQTVSALGGQNGLLYALDAASGNMQWHQSFTWDSGPGSLVAAQGTLVLGLSEGDQPAKGKLLALDTKDGHFLWQRSLGDGLVSISLASSRIYLVTSFASFQAFNLADGTDAWSNTSLHLSQNGYIQIASMLAGPTTAYVAISSSNANALNVMAVDASNGKSQWSDPGCDSSSTPSATGAGATRCYWHYQSGYQHTGIQLLQVDA